MLKHAYELGTLLALQEEGLLKTGAPTALEGAKIVGESTLSKLKDFFTGSKVREALRSIAAAKRQTGTALASPEAIAKKELWKSLTPYLATAGGAGVIGAGALTAPKIFPKLSD